jgi:two-component system, NarL family, nitrate/nitrite response regulator NarL
MEKKYKDARVRILVIDDHVILRQGIRELLNKEDDFEVVGEAENDLGALALTRELKPDIVLVDIALDHSSGMHIAKQLLRSSPNTRIVLYAGPNDEKLLFDTIRIGIHGYLQKSLVHS